MSTVPVYIGRWQDHSRNSTILGDVVTLDVRWGGYLIAALSTFVGLVGTALWSLLSFGIHQWHVERDKADGLYLQHQIMLRNPSSPISATWGFIKICWAWRKKRDPGVRVHRLKYRSFILALPPLVVFAVFVAAGIFVSEVAGKAYRSNDVLVKSGRCGFFSFDRATSGGNRAEQQKILNDTLAGRAYATNCYDSNTTIAECSLYPVQALQYETTTVDCPFGNDPKGQNLCKFDQNNAIQLDTGLMDTSEVLGINAAMVNRLQVRKTLTCSPVHSTNYVTIIDPYDPVDQFFMGPIINISTYTYEYTTHTALDRVGYQILPVFGPDGLGTWDPVAALQVPNGDVSAYFIASNSVQYLAPTEDILFQATTLEDIEGYFYYVGDFNVGVMGCVDQYQICNPNTTPSSCTVLGNLDDMVVGFQEIGLNEAQLATGERVIIPFILTSTFNSVNLMGDTALLARNRLVNLISTGLPNNQWQIEVQGWFETSLAKYQAYMVEWVTNTADLGPYGSVNAPNPENGAAGRTLNSLCSQQRIRNVGGYQTFSFLGLMIVVCVGSTTILLNWTVEPLVACLRDRSLKRHRRRGTVPKHDFREVARIADHKLQLQRMALLGAGFERYWDVKHVLDQVPVTKGTETVFALPTRTTVRGVEDYRYASNEPLLKGHLGRQGSENDEAGPADMPEEHPLRGGHGPEHDRAPGGGV